MIDRNEKMEGQGTVDVETLTNDVYQIYLYYIKFDQNGDWKIIAREYFHGAHAPIPSPEMKIKDLIAEVIQDPNPEDTTFDDFHRERKGLVALAIDGAKFGPGMGRVEFECDRAKDRTTKRQNGNHTFLPCPIRLDEIIAGRDVSVVTRKYDAKKFGAGRDLDMYEWEHFKIKLFGTRPGRVTEELLLEDSGGTNMGPPPRPPAFRPGRGPDGNR